MSSTQLSRTHTLTGPDEQEPKEKGVVRTGVGVPVLEASDAEEQTLSRVRKLVVLGVLCSAQFFDIFIGNAVVVSLPSLGEDLHFTPGALQWILSAYTLTFASFMLIAGSLSDIFHPKPIFCLGFALIGIFSVPVGASVHPIMAIVFRAARCIPMGVAGGVASFLAGKYVPRLNPKHILVCSQTLVALGSVLFALAGGERVEARYWSYIFPGMVVGMFGLAGAYVGCTTMVMGGARKGEEGVVGAVMYTAYQVGATLGFAVVTSITEGVNAGRPADPASLFAGYAASFWSMVAMPIVMLFIALLFVRP